MNLATLLAVVTFASLVAYAVLAGADFGAGIWDLVARGDRRPSGRAGQGDRAGVGSQPRLADLPRRAAVHVLPRRLRASVALFWLLHLVLIGIVLRGSATSSAPTPPAATRPARRGDTCSAHRAR
jgi:cytochrome d ubiquinol oxidase subunit II